MKSQLILFLLACSISIAYSQNYRYLNYSLRSMGQASVTLSEENRYNGSSLSFEQLRPGLALAAGMGRQLKNTPFRFQAEIGLSYNLHFNDRSFTELNQLNESLIITSLRRRYTSVQLEFMPSLIYTFENSAWDFRLGYRMTLQNYHFGEYRYLVTFNSFSGGRIGNPIANELRFEVEYADWGLEVFGWMEFGTKYWFNEYRDLGIEIFGALSPSVFGKEGTFYSYLFGVNLIQRWDRPAKK